MQHAILSNLVAVSDLLFIYFSFYILFMQDHHSNTTARVPLADDTEMYCIYL